MPFFIIFGINKYYIGKTEALEFDIRQHRNGGFALWSMIYKYKSHEVLVYNPDEFDEDKYTLKYMNKYGIENVRGGSFITYELTRDEISVIKQMIEHARNECSKCGSKTHFVKRCPYKISMLESIYKYILSFVKKLTL